jgi:hypothetical protein
MFLNPNKRRYTDMFYADPSLTPNQIPMNEMPKLNMPQEQDQTGNMLGNALTLATALKGGGAGQAGLFTNALTQYKPDTTTVNNSPMITGGGITPTAKTTNPYDMWGKPIFGNMPLSQFVQLAGITANALAPHEFGGRLGGAMANLAGQAEHNKIAYDWRTQERNDRKISDLLGYVGNSKLPLAFRQKALDYVGSLYGDENNPFAGFKLDDARTDLIPQLQAIFSNPDIKDKRGAAAQLLYGAGDLTGDQLIDSLKTNTSQAHNVIEVPNPDGKTAQHFQYNADTNRYDIPVEDKPYKVKSQVPNINVHSGGGSEDKVLVPVEDENGNVTYQPRVRAIGKKVPSKSEVKEKDLLDIEGKILDPENDTTAVAAQVEFYNKHSPNSQYVWKPGRLYGGTWEKKPKTGGRNSGGNKESGRNYLNK